MEAGSLIEILEYKQEGYRPLVDFESWRVAFLRHNERFASLTGLERHLETDEVFVLLEGEATLHVKDESGALLTYAMAECTVYNVKRGVWHHIVVSEDATVLIVENANTTKENTERINVE